MGEKKFKQDDLSHGSGKNPVQVVFPPTRMSPASHAMTYDFNGATIYTPRARQLSARLRQRYTLNPDLVPKVQAYIVPISNRYPTPNIIVFGRSFNDM